MVCIIYRPSPPRPAPAAPATVVRQWAALEQRLPTDRQLQQWTSELDKPLDQEMRAIWHDTRSAVETLAQGFLPDTLQQDLTSKRDAD